MSRSMERDSASTMLGMGQARFGAARDAKAQATQAYAQGAGNIAGGVLGAAVGFHTDPLNGSKLAKSPWWGALTGVKQQ